MGCQLIERAKKDPSTGEENNKLCPGDCDHCHFYISESIVKIPEVLIQKIKDTTPEKLEFVTYILDTVLTITNELLSKGGMKDFFYYKNNKNNNKANSNIFQYACSLFNQNLIDLLDKIRIDIFRGVTE